MTNLITVKAVYKNCDNKIWREIQISENSYLCQLGYVLLSTFDTMAYHLFCIEHSGVNYELPNEDEQVRSDRSLLSVKLSELKLNAGDKLTMIYDFGCEQVFDIEIVEVAPMAKGSGRAYPKVIAGEGLGIIDDMTADELLEAINDIDQNGDSVYYYESKRPDIPWDYRKYNIDYDNALLKGELEIISENYGY